jgi:predicted phage-related endonuclease
MPPLSERNQAKRAGRVGASSVAGLLDCGSPWTNPAKIYAWVAHGIDTFAGNPAAAEMGHTLEGTVVKMGRDKTGVNVRRNSLTRIHPELPLAVTCDGYVTGTGQTIPVEIKTASAYAADEWAGGAVPPHYMAQVQAQLMVTGGAYAHLWALIGGRDLHTRIIESDHDHPVWGHAVIAQRITDFWAEHVLPGIPPPDTPPALLLSFEVPEGVGAPTGEIETVGGMVADLMAEQDRVKQSLEDAREGLLQRMAEQKLRLVSGAEWSAEVKTSTKGLSSLRFTRARKRKG